MQQKDVIFSYRNEYIIFTVKHRYLYHNNKEMNFSHKSEMPMSVA